MARTSDQLVIITMPPTREQGTRRSYALAAVMFAGSARSRHRRETWGLTLPYDAIRYVVWESRPDAVSPASAVQAKRWWRDFFSPSGMMAEEETEANRGTIRC